MIESKNSWQDSYNRAIQLLAAREHSAQELMSKLLRKGFEHDDVEIAIGMLQEQNLQSDQRFVDVFVRSRSQRGHGPTKISHELRQKGITAELIEEAVNAQGSHWFDYARQHYQKKYRNTVVNNYNEWTKRARFMQNRGYTMEHIKAIVEFDQKSADYE